MIFCKHCGQELNMAGAVHECYGRIDLGSGRPLREIKPGRMGNEEQTSNAETMRRLSERSKNDAR